MNVWWPNGYGDSPIYQLNATYVDKSGETHPETINVGFRTVHLIETELGNYQRKNTENYI